MGAHAADLDMAGKAHAFSRHRRQPAIDAQADESTHGVRPRKEGPGLCQLGQGQHLRRVGIAEQLHAVIGLQPTGRHHLHALCSLGGAQARWHRDGWNLEDIDAVVARLHQVGERHQAVGTFVGRRGKASWPAW